MNEQARPVLSNSSANLWTECPKKYEIENIMGFSPRVTGFALRTGILAHELQEDYWGFVKTYGDDVASGKRAIPGAIHDLEVLFKLTTDNWIEEQKRLYKAYANATGDYDTAMKAMSLDSDAKKTEELWENVNLVTGMMNRHSEKYLARDCKQWDVIAIEQSFRLPLPTPTGRKSKWDYAGKIDIVVKDKKTGLVYVMDHKTSINKPEKFMREMDLTPQMRGYKWALETLTGEEVHGIVFNFMRRKLPSTPKVLKKPKDGRKLSVAATDTTYQIYKAAIEEHDPGNEQAYEEVLNKLLAHGETFHTRREIYIPKEAVDQWLLDRYGVANAINHALRKDGIGCIRNYRACSVFGNSCPYRSVCLDPLASKSDWDMFKKREVKSLTSSELSEDDGEEFDWEF